MTCEDVLPYLRKESLDIFNRLRSIEEDILFVDLVYRTYPSMPLLPNLRCGAWYTNPDVATPVPAYFKSTDGHTNNWSFNLRRANLHLLPLIIERKGIILVDSTRSGKKIPDALSKTVPIWCAVINRAMLIRFPELKEAHHGQGWNAALYTPPSTVSRQEHDRIEERLDGWAQDLANSSFTLPRLPSPLRPVWITPATTSFPSFPSASANEQPPFLPVICVSASKQVDLGLERRSAGFAYVQGSGDDHELWGMGLTPDMFWAHRTRLLEAERVRIPELVAEIVRDSQKSTISMQRAFSPVHRVNGRLQLAAIADLPLPSSDDTMRYLILVPSVDNESHSPSSRVYIPTGAGKKAQAQFIQTVLPLSMDIIGQFLQQGHDICVACESGKETSVGVVLTALQLYFADDGSYISESTSHTITDKQSIRTRLEWIIESRPVANPSRAVLKRVNEYLMSPASFRRVPSVPVL